MSHFGEIKIYFSRLCLEFDLKQDHTVVWTKAGVVIKELNNQDSMNIQMVFVDMLLV